MLILEHEPDLTYREVIERVLAGARPLPALKGKWESIEGAALHAF